MSTLPLRRSARIIARDLARPNRTSNDIQATLLAVKQMHTRTVLDVWCRIKTDFDRFEQLIQERSRPYSKYRAFREKLYLEKITSLFVQYDKYRTFVLHTINGLNEKKISGVIPCVATMVNLGQSLTDFVGSLQHDLENDYVMNELVIPFCDSKINLIKSQK
jgi:hypothetical protein